MSRYTLTPHADLAVFYAADAARYAGTQVLADVTLATFQRFYADCPSRGFSYDGQPIGGMIFDGSQAHLAVLAAHHGHWGRLLAPTLEWMFGLQPEMHIDIEAGNHKALAFMHRNGWQRVAGEPPGSIRFLVIRAEPKTCRHKLMAPG